MIKINKQFLFALKFALTIVIGFILGIIIGIFEPKTSEITPLMYGLLFSLCMAAPTSFIYIPEILKKKEAD